MRKILLTLMTSVICTSLSGCLLVAAGAAGGAAGYLAGKESSKSHEHHEERTTEVEVHHDAD
jgi:hypothetical protein